jgi:hypothetical protein
LRRMLPKFGAALFEFERFSARFMWSGHSHFFDRRSSSASRPSILHCSARVANKSLCQSSRHTYASMFRIRNSLLQRR